MIALFRGLWSGLSLHPWKGMLAIIVLQAVSLWFVSGQRDDLREWKTDVVQATRDAADHPKLATSAVPQQIRNFGAAITKTRSAMWQAKAEATAAKLAADTANENRRKDADYGLAPTLERALGRTDAYARAGGVQCEPRAAPINRSDDRRGDLPGTAEPAQVADRPGAGPALVLIPRSALDTCTTLKVRLDNARDWAVGGQR